MVGSIIVDKFILSGTLQAITVLPFMEPFFRVWNAVENVIANEMF